MEKETIEAAITDVEYHRDELMGIPLHPPQVEAINLIEQHIADRSGKTITIRSARQTMKNECSATIQLRILKIFEHEGGIYIRTAPTWKPQIVNSLLRLERLIRMDPLTRGKVRPRMGYIFELGNAQVQFLSTDKQASIVGATASIALDIDEAHKVDKGKFDEEIAPFTAMYDPPVIMWGVAADKQDLLYEHLQKNKEQDPDCVLEFPAKTWCEFLPSYARHYESRVRHLGAGHPVIKTQYDLEDIEAIAAFLKDYHRMILFGSDHPRQIAPKEGRHYAIVIDIAGEAEIQADDEVIRAEDPYRDSTVALIADVDLSDIKDGRPMARIVDAYWWTGQPLSDGSSGFPGVQSWLAKLVSTWRPRWGLVDARGVGSQIAGFLQKEFSVMKAYEATDTTVSEDCYELLAWLNNERLMAWRNDESKEYEEFSKQAARTNYEIKNHEKMRIVKKNKKEHIDFMKALTYLPRAIGKAVLPAGGSSETQASDYHADRRDVLRRIRDRSKRRRR